MSQSMTEFELIEKLKKTLAPRSPRILKGIGDDTAVISASGQPLLFCSDLMIESVHFNLNWMSAFELGHKALASCFSDLVAMNGTGLAATASLALPKSVQPAFVTEFYEGLDSFAKIAGIDCVGGDLSLSPTLIYLDVACLGESEKPVLRSGAQVGDKLVVSGTPGASAAGLAELEARGRTSETLRQKHLRPLPRFDLQPSLHTFTSLIDISDGLASEAQHLGAASGVGFEIFAEKIPLHEEALKVAESLSSSALEMALDWALNGGEDYELLGTLPDSQPVPQGFTVIGRAIEGLDLWLKFSDQTERRLTPRGFDHFRR